PPPELVGRDAILQQAAVLIARVQRGRPEKSMLLTGLRGVGKTVLLNEIDRRAAETGARTVALEAQEKRHIGQLLAPSLRKLLFDLDRLAGAGDRVRRGLAVLRSFVSGIKVRVGDIDIGLDIEPERGTADSGDLDSDLTNLFVAIGEAARERRSLAVLLVDEIQYVNRNQLGALIVAMHRVQQLQLPLVLVGAGLPVLPALAGDARTYAERLFAFPDVGPLSRKDAALALTQPTRRLGVAFDVDALESIHENTQGYPYFVQEWGYQAWNTAAASRITRQDVLLASEDVVRRLDDNFFRVRFDRLTPTEKLCLRAMAELGPGPHRTGDVADGLGRKTTAMSTIRANLIAKGMIFSPAHGEMAFTVPLFDGFMKRVMPQFLAE
ncbi:MAG TPA: ATP-binding protein, partial [Trueperaceae bacterium]|nr:ATP-binding protein [Trueperaceae bacterium]